MIDIQTRRAGMFVIAATVHGDLSVTCALGLTDEGARRALCRRLDRMAATP